jgi:heme-degrading monooxygenase HmoA
MFFVRFVRLQVREGREAELWTYYEERVIPALDATEGCLFAGLLRPWRGSDYQSLTIWQSAEHAHAYETKGHYHALLRGAEPYLSAATSWRVRLGSDPEETFDHERREIPPDEYTLGAGDGTESLAETHPSTYVRIVSIRVADGRLDEFRSIYEETVLPVVKKQPGCRGVLLAEGLASRGEILSISLWNREEDAVRYELSGEFERLTHRLSGTFSPLRDWGMSLGAGSDDPLGGTAVEGYHFVTARRL